MQNKTLTLCTYFRSSTSWRVRIALNLKNIPHQFKFINLAKGEQKNQQYKKINPNIGVPSLILSSGQILIQSAAIIQYLEDVYPQVPLYPKDPIQKAKIRGFCEVINSGLHPYQNLRVLQKVQKDFQGDKKKWATDWVVRGMILLQEMLQKTKGKYCFGDQVTAADLFFVPHVQGGSVRFGVDLKDYPTINEVLENLKKLEAFDKASPMNQPDATK